MKIDQFRNIMGLLGQNENPFLADRIFECFAVNSTGSIEIE